MQYVVNCALGYRGESLLPLLGLFIQGVTASATPCHTQQPKMCSQFALWGCKPQKSKQTGVRTHANT